MARKKFHSEAMKKILGLDAEPEELPPPTEESEEATAPPKSRAWDKKMSIYLTNEEYELFSLYAFRHKKRISRVIIDAAKEHIEMMDEFSEGIDEK